MSFVEGAVLVSIVLGIGALSWLIASRLSNPPKGPSEEQRRMVANNFMKGAQLMGRCNGKKEDSGRVTSPSSSDADSTRPKTADSSVRGPSKEDLREAIRFFDEGLKAYPNDFSTRFLKAQALEELGEFSEALHELDWLLSQRGSVKPNFVRRMAMALGVMESRSVAPLGTKLLGTCEVDLVVFHIRKRKGRVLLKKRRVADAIHEIKLAYGVLDKLAWNEELQRREERVNLKMKTLRQPSPGKENKEGPAAAIRGSSQNRVVPGSSDEAQKLLDRSNLAADDSALYREEDAGSNAEKGSAFKTPHARAELNILLARCFEEQGNVKEAARCLEEASRIGSADTKEDARIAMLRLQQGGDNGDKSE